MISNRFGNIRAGALRAALLSVTFYAAGAGAPASAQMFGWWGYQPFETQESLTPGEVRRDLQRRGYRVTGPLIRNGRVLLADVVDGRGRSLRLIVDPVEGEILQRFVNVDPTPRRDPAPDVSDPAQPAPAARARKPVSAPKVAVRTLPAKPKVRRDAQPPSEATLTPPPNRAPVERVREPAVANSPAAPQRVESVAPARPAAPPAAPSSPEAPGFTKGVPINPLD